MKVLFVGKPSPGKGWLVFSQVVQWAATAQAPIEFWQIGPWPPVWQVTPKSNLLALGPCAPAQVAAWMEASDVVVVPSITCDALPRVALEAQALGVPVIASRVGGLPEIVEDGVTGRLVPPGDWRALRDALLDLAADPALRRRYGQAARQRVQERFSPAQTTALLREVYHRLLQ